MVYRRRRYRRRKKRNGRRMWGTQGTRHRIKYTHAPYFGGVARQQGIQRLRRRGLGRWKSGKYPRRYWAGGNRRGVTGRRPRIKGSRRARAQDARQQNTYSAWRHYREAHSLGWDN